MTAPLISYIVTVFNKQDYIVQTLDSIRAQAAFSQTPVEIILSDDCSTDGSLELLKAEASRDSRLHIIENKRNLGPAVRINQAAAAATGTYIIPVDGDDTVPRNGSRFFLDCAGRHRVPIVFGRARRSLQCNDIPANARVRLIDEPLVYCAENQITHMGFFVETPIWRASGGADEAVFVQDQSLHLRLCAVAPKLAHVEATTYCLRPADVQSLSRNVIQQHHDRFLSVFHLLQQGNLTLRARRALTRQAISSLWKLQRDQHSGLTWLSAAFARYLVNRVAPWSPGEDMLQQLLPSVLAIPGVRRMDGSA